MAIKVQLSKVQEQAIINHIKDTSTEYTNLLSTKWKSFLEIYEAVTTFTSKKEQDWYTDFKVNKAHEVIHKILPRVIARNPKRIVSLRTDEFNEEDAQLSEEEKIEKLENLKDIGIVIQDYLTYNFDKYALGEKLELWAKSMITYWQAFARVNYKYELWRDYASQEETQIDPLGNQYNQVSKKVKEKIIGEYTDIDVISWSQILYDPRYQRMSDMPAIIESKEWVRLSYFTQNKDDYENIDILTSICNTPRSDEWDNYKKMIESIAGIQYTWAKGWVNRNNLKIKEYSWLYEIKPEAEQKGEWEKLYRFITVNDLVVVKAEEIYHLPYEQIRCFEDPETNFATGFVEPILWLQNELNYKKNAASRFINQSLNREWIWSPMSKVNPKTLISKPWNIIVTQADWQTAQNNLIELAFRQIPAEYFNEGNDFERQIQSLTFTVDTSQDRSNESLTNTATWIKVKFFESNSVIDYVRKKFEAWCERIAYKLLECAYDNMDDNIIVKRLGDEWYWQLNKEMFKDALRRYSIKIEAGSSSFDSIEQRREDAIAFFNMLTQAQQLWVPVNLVEWFKDVISTFEKKDADKFISQEQQPMWMWGYNPLQAPEQQSTNAQQVTQAVAGWKQLFW